MNPGKLNHRIRFAQLTATPNDYGYASPVETPVVCTDIAPTDTTWGDLQPIRQYNQFAIEQGASVLNGDKMLIIRYRQSWQPTKDMIFEDMNTPGDIYTIKSILPYQQGAKSTFQNSDSKVYKDRDYIFILGIKRQ